MKTWSVVAIRRLIAGLTSLAAMSGAWCFVRADSGSSPASKNHVKSAHKSGVNRWTDIECEWVGWATDHGVSTPAGAKIIRLGPRPLYHWAHKINLILPDEQRLALDLEPISVRDPGYQLREQVADGSWRTIDPGPENTFTGVVVGDPGSEVAAGWTSQGLLASVATSDGRKRWIQPLSDFVPGAESDLHIVYFSEESRCEGTCGNAFAPDPAPPSDNPAPHGTCGGGICVAQLACDADFEYYTARGSNTHNTQDRIFAIINVVNHQYVQQVQITHVITTVLVRTAEPDPYTSNVSDTLMCQVITEWTDNQTAVTRDLTKLFTGRDISGSTVGQAANTNQICDNDGFCTAGLDNGAYCYTQSDFSPTFACQTDNTAHQIGHLWGAFDCNCPNSTMNSTISCANTFANSGGVSVAEIDAHADQVLCLTALNNPPENNTCINATILPGSGTYAGSNVNASTDGGALNCGILSGDVGGGRNDVFYRITPIANGTVSVDTCGSNFDTLLSIHTGCPATPANQIVCNDDCGGTCDVDSCLTFAGTNGTTYYIRVSGYAGATGSIVLNVSGPFTPGNDLCANAVSVTDGTSTSGTLAFATNDGSANCGTSATNPDAWYTYTAGPCGGSLTVDTCGTHDRLGQDTGMDTVLSLHTACPGTSANQIVCIDDASPACTGDAGLIRDSRAVLNLSPNQTVLIRVTHFSASIDDGFFFLNVAFTPATLAPVVNDIPNAASACGVAYTGPTPSVTSPGCMSPLTWSLISAPPGMTINPTTGVVSWPDTTSDDSPYSITIRATNATGFDNESWMLTVNPIAPFIEAIPNASHPCGSAYTGPTPVLTDPDCMNPVVWSVVVFPPGMTIDPATGVVSWPTPTVAGSPHPITIRATNSTSFRAEDWFLTVLPTAPVVTAIADQAHPCGSAYIGPTPSVTNPTCMNPVTWSLNTGPPGMTINPFTGVVSWPTPTIAGSPHTVVIQATNATGFDVEGWRVNVTPIAPIINAIADASIPETVPYAGSTPSLSNPMCMAPISAWTLVTGPAGMTINSANGVVSWPAPTTVGSPHGVTIRATNATAFDDESWTLTVTPGGLRGDLDCNGTVNGLDVDAFVLRLLSQAAYEIAYPGCPLLNGDIDHNGVVNNLDVGPFAACVLAGGCP